jgi:hypothetical protein
MLALCASDAVDDCVVFMVLLADIQKMNLVKKQATDNP